MTIRYIPVCCSRFPPCESFDMDARRQQLQIIADMELRQDDLLRRLEELDQRIKRVLAECLGPVQVDATPETQTAKAA
jgi:hypothetical protein